MDRWRWKARSICGSAAWFRLTALTLWRMLAFHWRSSVLGKSFLGADMTQPSELRIYCLKCKERTGTTDLVQFTMTNGRPAEKGKCLVCGSIKNRVVKKAA